MDTNTKFKVGDLVRLKSGGPTMTVHGKDADGNVVTNWFVGGEKRCDYFSADALELAPKEVDVENSPTYFE